MLTWRFDEVDEFFEEVRVDVQRRALVPVIITNIMQRMRALQHQNKAKIKNQKSITRPRLPRHSTNKSKRLTSTDPDPSSSSSYIALSIHFTFSNWSSAGHVTLFFFFPSFCGGGVPIPTPGGVDAAAATAAGDPRLPFAMSFSASWKGSIADGCATFGSGSFFGTADPLVPADVEAEAEGGGGGAGAGASAAAFLKLGSFGFGFGAEKKDESALGSLPDPEAEGPLFDDVEADDDFGSFLTAGDFDDDAEEKVVVVVEEEEEARACFFAGGPDFDMRGSDFRFLAVCLLCVCVFVCALVFFLIDVVFICSFVFVVLS